jgi:hypothetical protein
MGEGVFPPTYVVTGHEFVWYRSITTTSRLHVFNITEETYTNYELAADFPNEGSTAQAQTYIDFKGAILTYVDESPYDEDLVLIKADKLVQTDAILPTILVDLSDRAGLDSSFIDTTDITATSISDGYFLDNPVTARGAIEQLAKFFLFDGVESDNTIKFVSRGQASSFAIAEDDLGEIGDTGEAYKYTRAQEAKLPRRATLSFVDVDREYETNTVGWSRPRAPLPVMRSKDVLDVSLPISIDPVRAKTQVKKYLYSIWAERESRQYMLPWEYLKQDPTDVATVTLNDATTWEDRMLQMDIGLNYTVDVQSIAQRAASYVDDTSITFATRGGVQSIGVRTVPPIVFLSIMDIPYVEDPDNVGQSSGLYYYGFRPASPGFEYAALEKQTPPNPWVVAGGSIYEDPWGRVISTIPDPPNGIFAIDDTSTITLRPGFDFTGVYTWAASATTEPESSNAILIGNDVRGWELIYFRDVTVNGDGSVDISYMRRARRGTDPYATGHMPGEYFLLVDVDGFLSDIYDLSLIGVQQNFRASSPGLLANLSPTTSKSMTGASLKPYAPLKWDREEDTPSASDIRITWERRTRLGGRLINDTGGEVPMNEEAESYEIYLLPTAIADEAAALAFDPTDTTSYTRKFTATDNVVDYTAAMRTTDSHTGDDDIYVIGYQISAEVGRGFPGFATLTKIRTT